MKICHHPSSALMLDYGTGNIGPAAELAIAAHLRYCPDCRGISRVLDAVGGRLLAEGTGEAPQRDELDRIVTRLGEERPERGAVSAPREAVFPTPLGDVLEGNLEAVSWKRLGMGAYHYVVPMDDPVAIVRLLKIPAGRPVPVHTHRGTEITLVLCGAFSDATGAYQQGDLQEADDTLVHQPHAAPGQDCVCLAVTEAPLRFKSWAARLVQPFLGI